MCIHKESFYNQHRPIWTSCTAPMHTHYVKHIISNPRDQDKWDKWGGWNHICCSSPLPQVFKPQNYIITGTGLYWKYTQGLLWLAFLHLCLMQSSIHFQSGGMYIYPSTVCLYYFEHFCFMMLHCSTLLHFRGKKICFTSVNLSDIFSYYFLDWFC